MPEPAGVDDSYSHQDDEPSGCSVPAAGDICPVCGLGRMDYDGLLILVCPVCGYQAGGGGFT